MILTIETSTPVCSVALHETSGRLLAEQVYHSDKSHSVLLPGIIGELLANTQKSKNDLEAVAISAGPGSYTGLRIGLSVAKGLCFALDIPLIAIDTLDTLIEEARSWVDETDLICPMIDARRMEVYTKLVSHAGGEIWPVQPLIIDENTFMHFQDQPIWLLGSGAAKCQGVIQHPHYRIIRSIHPSASNAGKLAVIKYEHQQIEDLAYYEPNYLKEFQTKKASNKLLG